MSKEQIAAGAQIGGSVGQVVSGFRAGSAVDRQARAAAKQRMLNAEIDIRQSRQQSERVLGKQSATIATSGLAMSGSPLAFMLETAREAALEAELIKRGAMIEAQAIKSRGRAASAKARSGALGSLTRTGMLINKNQSILADLWEDVFGRGGSDNDTADTFDLY